MKPLSSKWNFPAGRRFYFLCYSLLFLLLSLLVFSPFIENGKSFIWKPDGLTQHFNSLVYFRNWGISIVRTLLTQHRLTIPLWDSTIGYGSDILTTLHYYVIGDPLNLLSFLVPVRFLETFYGALILLRLYLAGITFSCYCFRMKRGGAAVLAGSLIYVFSGYGFVLAPMHPYFINPMIYLPLILIGVERVFHKEKGHLLIASAALSALSNFYFFYMLAVLTALYCVIRFCTMKHENWKRDLGRCLCRTIFFSLTGTAVSAVLLFPVLLQFLSDMRSDTSLTYAPIYGWNYYEHLPDQFLSPAYTGSWTYLCFATPALMCVFLMFLKRRQFKALKIGFLVLTAFLLIPAAGSFLNGFSYAANRWSFGYSFLIALIVVFLWPELFSLTSREKCLLLPLFLLYGVLLFLMRTSGSAQAFFSLFLLVLTLFVVTEGPAVRNTFSLARKFPHSIPAALILLLSVNISFNSISFYRGNMDNHMRRFVDAGKGLYALEQSASAMVNVFLEEPDTFSRYAQDLVPVRNDSLNWKAHGLHYYWSLSNGAIIQFFNELAMPFEERAFKYDGLDNRAQLHALAGVRWYVRHDPSHYVPYPFTDSQVFDYQGDVYYVDETGTFLPFGYTCPSVISRDTYDELTYLERQQALLQGVVCETLPEGYPEASLHFQEQAVPFQLSYDPEDILELDNTYYVKNEHAKLTLTFEGLPQCETYLLIEGLDAHSLNELELYTKEPSAPFFQEEWEAMAVTDQRQKKRDHFYSPAVSQFPIYCASDMLDTTFCYYSGLTESSYDRSDFLLNMGYSQEGQHSITLELPHRGAYSFDKLSLYCLPLYTLSDQTEALGREHLEHVSFTDNQITGSITLTEPKMLCLSIPYSDGWSALVDGKTVPVCQADTMYMALPLESGEHQVELRYRTPCLMAGLLGSGLGLAVWGLYLLLTRRKGGVTK